MSKRGADLRQKTILNVAHKPDHGDMGIDITSRGRYQVPFQAYILKDFWDFCDRILSLQICQVLSNRDFCIDRQTHFGSARKIFMQYPKKCSLGRH